MSAAERAQKPVIASDQSTATPTIVSWNPKASRLPANSSAPPTIHGRRRPNRETVRSLNAPVSG